MLMDGDWMMELFSPLQANSCSTIWLKHCSICLLRWIESSACEALSREDKGTISMRPSK